MQITPYLVFNGQCEAAFKHYEKVLAGKIEMLTRFGEQMLMASDCPPDQYQKPAGTAVSISVDDRDEGERIFKALAKGGTEQMAFAETFWAEGFGMCVDRFGTPWMVNAGGKGPTA